MCYVKLHSLQPHLLGIKRTETRLIQNLYGSNFAWVMNRKGFYKMAEAGLADIIPFNLIPEGAICKIAGHGKFCYLNLKYMLECRNEHIRWCWIDNARNSPETLKMVDDIFKEEKNYTKFRPFGFEIDVYCVYIRNDEPYFNQITREIFL